MLLSVKKRQQYLKELGYYKGNIDGITGKLTKQAYRDLQNDYFTRKSDCDSLYGKNTDILLRSAYNCRNLKYFKLTEFKCQCKTKYCTGYPAELNKDLVANLDAMREHFGLATTIVSGMRCSRHNKNVGGSNGSRHKTGRAADIYINGLSTNKAGRQRIIDHWITTYNTSRYAYCNGYARTKAQTTYPTVSTMGTSTHVDVK